MPRPGNSGQRGYGHAHRMRARELKATMRDGDPCCRCGQPMYRIHLHLIDADHRGKARILGGELPDALAHRGCNRRAGAILGNQLRGLRRHGPHGRPRTQAPTLPEW